GIQPRRGSVGGLRMRRAIAATSPVARSPFGVLFRFQIPHFNLFFGFFGFFSLFHFHSSVLFVSFSNTEFLKIVLGRNSRLGYLLCCGGRSFLIKKFWKNRRARGWSRGTGLQVKGGHPRPLCECHRPPRRSPWRPGDPVSGSDRA